MKCYHFVGTPPYYTNCFLIITDNNNAIAIDPNAPLSLYEGRLNEHLAKLTHILLTHGHNDHTGAIPQLLKKFPDAKIYIGKQDASLFGIDANSFFADGETVKIDEAEFKIITTPGHTQGCVCIRLEDMLFTGDTLFAGNIGRTDLKGGDYDMLVSSLKKLCDEIQDNPQVLPGHGDFSDMQTEKINNSYLQF